MSKKETKKELEPKVEQALNVVAQACALAKGTLQDHQTIQASIQVIRTALTKQLENSK